MNNESGRSLLEVIGVLAITGIMTISGIGVFNVIRQNQARSIASAELEQIAQNTKILLEMRGNYDGVSVDYLIKSRALKSNRAPIGGDDWSVKSAFDGTSFSINLVDLTYGECEYFSVSVPDWAKSVLINGFEIGLTDNCFKSKTNQISFVVE